MEPELQMDERNAPDYYKELSHPRRPCQAIIAATFVNSRATANDLVCASVSGAAAAGVVALAGDKGAIGARQEVYHGCDLFGRAGAAHRDFLRHVVDCRGRELVENLGADHGGRD